MSVYMSVFNVFPILSVLFVSWGVWNKTWNAYFCVGVLAGFGGVQVLWWSTLSGPSTVIRMILNTTKRSTRILEKVRSLPRYVCMDVTVPAETREYIISIYIHTHTHTHTHRILWKWCSLACMFHLSPFCKFKFQCFHFLCNLLGLSYQISFSLSITMTCYFYIRMVAAWIHT